MTNDTIQIKVKQRINKLASNDYDNIMPWQIVEAFNKGMVAWCRRNLMGTNMSKTGDEASKRRIDDLQILLTDKPLQMVKKDLYYQSPTLPADYLEWKRISAYAQKDCCDKRKMVIYLAEEANVDELLRDYNKKPSFEWGETFSTVLGNKIKIYTNNDFNIESAVLTYYRQPTRIQIPGVSDPYTGQISSVDVECEFKDDLVELFIDECVKILAGDLEDVTANQIADNSVETNN
jgi:hypothetical protein